VFIDRVLPASIHGLVALAFAFAIKRLFRKLPANLQAWIWRLALGRFLVALFFEIPLPLLPSAAPAPVAESISYEVVDLPMPTAVPEAPSQWPTFFTACWLVGTAVVAAIAIARTFQLWRVSRRATPHPDGFRLSTESELPFLVGNQIVLPASLNADDRALALAHERAHAQRLEPLFSLPNFAVSALFWFVLPVRWALREYAVQVEIDCDRRAMRSCSVSPRQYGGMLVALATGTARNPQVGAAAVFMTGSHADLSRRLKAMNKPSQSRQLGALALTLALGILVIAPIRPVEARQIDPSILVAQEEPDKAQKFPPGSGPEESIRQAEEEVRLAQLAVTEDRIRAAADRIQAAEVAKKYRLAAPGIEKARKPAKIAAERKMKLDAKNGKLISAAELEALRKQLAALTAELRKVKKDMERNQLDKERALGPASSIGTTVNLQKVRRQLAEVRATIPQVLKGAKGDMAVLRQIPGGLPAGVTLSALAAPAEVFEFRFSGLAGQTPALIPPTAAAAPAAPTGEPGLPPLPAGEPALPPMSSAPLGVPEFPAAAAGSEVRVIGTNIIVLADGTKLIIQRPQPKRVKGTKSAPTKPKKPAAPKKKNS